MVTIDGPKVIDFGIVRALDGSTTSGLTSTGVVIGSPGFMAPEQILGERLTPASDIFSSAPCWPSRRRAPPSTPAAFLTWPLFWWTLGWTELSSPKAPVGDVDYLY